MTIGLLSLKLTSTLFRLFGTFSRNLIANQSWKVENPRNRKIPITNKEKEEQYFIQLRKLMMNSRKNKKSYQCLPDKLYISLSLSLPGDDESLGKCVSRLLRLTHW